MSKEVSKIFVDSFLKLGTQFFIQESRMGMESCISNKSAD